MAPTLQRANRHIMSSTSPFRLPMLMRGTCTKIGKHSVGGKRGRGHSPKHVMRYCFSHLHSAIELFKGALDPSGSCAPVYPLPHPCAEAHLLRPRPSSLENRYDGGVWLREKPSQHPPSHTKRLVCPPYPIIGVERVTPPTPCP